VLVHTVVQLALDGAAIAIRGKNEPRPGRAQLGDLGAQPLELAAPRLDLFGLQSYRPPGLGLSGDSPSPQPGRQGGQHSIIAMAASCRMARRRHTSC
jgi:hypothetical protein